MNCSPPGFSVHGILQARLLEWVAISSPEDLPDLGIKPTSLVWAGGFFTTEPPGKHELSMDLVYNNILLLILLL